ncbi:MAG: peptide deformylase [Synergistaceae bacterium]|nr:peptide deformylase [Synergistota bacterium]NLM71037.1 peptide deformylase [Synergistaceae bacterium]
MVREVLLLGDPLLRRRSEPIADFTDSALREEMKDLKEALERFRREHGFGRGIAAPQIGIARRMIALNLGSETFVIANPEIVRRSEETFTMWDDCMSFPDLLVRVRRHVSIDVRYMDEDGAAREWTDIDRARSELLQHETDHLDGILATDRAIKPEEIIYRSEYEKHRSFYDEQVD